jgi:predicted transcriptional regulator
MAPGDVDEEKRATLRRFAALGAVGSTSLSRISGAARADDGGGDGNGVGAREGIAGYLSTMPGAHFSKVRDDLSLGTGETQHHLSRLVEDGTVETFRDGDYRRYVIAGRFGEFEKTALGYLRRETPRGMLIELLRAPETAPGDLATALGVSAPTVSKYGRELEQAGLLSREDGYAVERPETVLTLVVRYADSFGDDAVALAGAADSLVRYDP